VVKGKERENGCSSPTSMRTLLIIPPCEVKDAMGGVGQLLAAFGASSEECALTLVDYNREFWREVPVKREQAFQDVDQWLDPVHFSRHLQARVQKALKPYLSDIVKNKTDLVGFYVHEGAWKTVGEKLALLRTMLPAVRLFCFGPAMTILRGKDLFRVLDAVIVDQTQLIPWLKQARQRPVGARLPGVLEAATMQIVPRPIPREPASGPFRNLPGKRRVLLALVPCWSDVSPALGVAQIAGALKQKGHEVRVVDYNAQFLSSLRRSGKRYPWADLQSFLLASESAYYKHHVQGVVEPFMEKLFRDIEVSGADTVGFSAYVTNAFLTESCMVALKERRPEVKILCGGPSVSWERALNWIHRGISDAAVIGEGELAAVELAEMWAKGSEASHAPIAGAFFRRPDGTHVKGPERSPSDLSEIPDPEFSDLDLSLYQEKELPFLLSRGCVARCIFCSDSKMWKVFRKKDIDATIQEIKAALERYGIWSFHARDLLLNGDHDHLEAFADRIVAEGLPIQWHGFVRIDKRLTDTLVTKMAKAGCRSISLGLESGSQRVLDLMRKNIDVRDTLPLVKRLHKAGIRLELLIIVGFPGENWIDFLKTLRMVFVLRRYITLLHVNRCTVHPGTPLFENREENGIIFDRFLGVSSWRTKYFENTFVHRWLRLWMLRKFVVVVKWFSPRSYIGFPDPRVTQETLM